jgi:REP-associated tyrosine transposase
VKQLTICVVKSYIIYMEHGYIHEQHTVHLVIYHIIWCPKRRRKVLVGLVHDRLKKIIEEVVHENGWQIIELAIQPDHAICFSEAIPIPCQQTLRVSSKVGRRMNCGKSFLTF